MANRNQYVDQLENLFSDVTPSHAHVAREPATGPVQEDLFGSLDEVPPAPPPSRNRFAQPVDDQSTSTARVELGKHVSREPTQTDTLGQHLERREGVHKTSFPWRSKIGRKLILAFLAAAILPSLIIAVFGGFIQVSQIRLTETNNLELVATLQQGQIENWIQSKTSELASLAHEPTLVRQIRSHLVAINTERDEQSTHLLIHARLSSFRAQHPEFEEVFLLNADAQVTASTDLAHRDQFERDKPYYVMGRDASYYGPPCSDDQLGKPKLVIAEPIRYITGEPIGVLVGMVPSAPMTQLVQDSPGLGESGEIFLVSRNGELVTSLRNEETPVCSELVRSLGIDRAIKGGSGHSTYSDHLGEAVFGAFRWLPEVQMGLIVERRVSEAYGFVFMAVGGTLLVTLIAVAVTAVLAAQMAHRIARPVVDITNAARKMIAGDLRQSVKVDSSDELGALAQAFNHLSCQLRTTIAGLEVNVAERTSQLERATHQYRKRAIHLEASAEISRAAASILEPHDLMQTTVNLIRDRFGFYNVSLFLPDETGNWAVVKASTGQVGQQMVAQPHRLAVGGNSTVGWVCAHHQPRIALDVGADADHFDHPLLPETRSEMVLPLVVGDQILGALDVQSSEEAAFDDDDVRGLQGMADLIAVALQNAFLFADTTQRAEHQFLVARVTDRLQRASCFHDVLTLTLEELAATFDPEEAIVCLGTEAELRASENGRDEEVGVVEAQPTLVRTAIRGPETQHTE